MGSANVGAGAGAGMMVAGDVMGGRVAAESLTVSREPGGACEAGRVSPGAVVP